MHATLQLINAVAESIRDAFYLKNTVISPAYMSNLMRNADK